MNEFLLIRIGSRAQDPIQWIIWSKQEQEVIASGELAGAEQLSALSEKAQNRAVYGLAPSSDLIFRTLTLPGRLTRQTRQALPFLLEETIATDIEQLQIHILGVQGHEVQVVAVEASRVEEWMSWFKTANLQLQRLIPDVLALPEPDENTYSGLQINQQWLFRKNKYEGSSIDLSWLPIWLDSQTHYPMNIHSYTPAPANSEKVLWETSLCDLPMQLLAEHLPEKHINLLQGAAHSASYWRKHWSVWRIPAFLAIAWMILAFSSTCIEYMQLKQKKEHLQQEMVLVYHRYFPQEKRVVNPKVQLKQHLAQVKDTNPDDFIQLLASTTPALKSVGQWELQGLSFDSSRHELHLQFSAQSPDIVEQLKKHLPAGYSLTTSKLQNQDKSVSGEFIIRSQS